MAQTQSLWGQRWQGGAAGRRAGPSEGDKAAASEAPQGARKSKAVAGIQNKGPDFISWLRNVHSTEASYTEVPASGRNYPEGCNCPDIPPLLPLENTPTFL